MTAADNTDNTDIDRAMNIHLTEDELVLHYYGEMSTSEETRATAHLTSCADCHENLRRLQRVLAVVEESALAGPELPALRPPNVCRRPPPQQRRVVLVVRVVARPPRLDRKRRPARRRRVHGRPAAPAIAG